MFIINDSRITNNKNTKNNKFAVFFYVLMMTNTLLVY